MNRLFNRLVINCRDNFELFLYNVLIGQKNKISFLSDLSIDFIEDGRLSTIKPKVLYIEDIDDNSIYLVYDIDGEEYDEEIGSLSLDCIIQLCEIVLKEIA